jgi:hypothetical protein
MTRKTTAYARKRHSQGKPLGVVNAAAWQNVFERCQPLSETAPIVQGIARSTDPAMLLIEANDALAQMLAHTVSPDNAKPYDCLACIIDVTHLRALQIAGANGHNPMHADLYAARVALMGIRQRWERIGRWGMSAVERAAMVTAVDHYETVLNASSAQQMHDAEQIWQHELQRKNYFTGTALEMA